MHLNVENCYSNGKSCRKMAVGLYSNDSGKKWTPGPHLPPPQGNIHVQVVSNSVVSKTPLVEVISHSRASLSICYCIPTLLVSNLVMMKNWLCRSDRKNTISFTLPVSNLEVKNY